MYDLFSHFRLDGEREAADTVIENIASGVEFTGTNLWILVFAIFIASLGLNVNSAAVVIGAMLVSPIMGPIIGLGMGMAINDLQLLRKAFYNYLFALGVGLGASTIYFTLSPLHEATSEILARTSPNIYDVLIALFGGFAGILAVSSTKKANVIPGVAIATALVPPLCTAGYGIANWNFAYFSGAIYLFVINTVFIALATLVTARFLEFPFKHLPVKHDEVVSKRIVTLVVIITILPSIYFGYDIVQQNRFTQRARKFIDTEAVFPNDYLLKREIDAKAKKIRLIYGGQLIAENEISALKSKLPQYDLGDVELEVQQGFAYLAESTDSDTAPDQQKQLADALTEKEKEIKDLQARVAAREAEADMRKQISAELRVQYPSVASCIVQRSAGEGEPDGSQTWQAVVLFDKKIADADKQRIEKWLQVRLQTDQVSVFFQPAAAPAKMHDQNVH